MAIKRQPVFDLDDEEKEISDSFDCGEWKSTKDLKKEINIAKKAAKITLARKKKLVLEFKQLICISLEKWLRNVV
ncbi:hypothetical protein [Rickettsiella massiliensis]|uniref:hypothetical protein n=1 Tax=Rickettsiella massiliensis TaxID=676517 RepID=UPI00029A2126|nr:hypothetical protein [Rickettsiella massiliensis]